MTPGSFPSGGHPLSDTVFTAKLPNIVRHTMSAKAEEVISSIFQRLGFPVVKREQLRVIIGILDTVQPTLPK